jgi:hypothetical protein
MLVGDLECVFMRNLPHLLMYLLLFNRKTKVKTNKGSTSYNTREPMIYYYSYYYYYYDYHYNIYIYIVYAFIIYLFTQLFTFLEQLKQGKGKVCKVNLA